MTGPIKPSEVTTVKASYIPDGVFEAFNTLIVENMDGNTARVKQCDVVARITLKLNCERQVVFDKGWLEIEDVYREVGWDVEYDKPGFNENYDAFFKFTRRKTA